MQHSQLVLIVKIILCMFFWGGTFIAGKIAAEYAPPALIGLLRFIISTLMLFMFMQSRKQSMKITRKQFWGLCILGLSGILGYNLFFFLGLQTIPASRAALIVANNPLLIAIGAVIFLKEKLSIIQCFGILISICGAVTIISNGNIREIFSSLSPGDFAIFGCVITWAIYSLAGKVLLQGLTPLATVTWACGLGTIFFIPFTIYQSDLSLVFDLPLTLWLCTFYLGAFGSAIGFVWFYEAIKGLGAAKAGVFISFVPIFGVMLGALILDESITKAMLVGGALTIIGVYLTNKK